MKSLLEEFKEVVHDELPKGLPPVGDIQYHGASILHDFEDPFMRKESARDEIFKFFKFMPPSISTWVRHGMLSFIPNCTFKDLHACEPIKYESMVYMYG